MNLQRKLLKQVLGEILGKFTGVKISQSSWNAAKIVIVPGELQVKGWKEFYGCLYRIFYKAKKDGSHGSVLQKDLGVCGGETTKDEIRSCWRGPQKDFLKRLTNSGNIAFENGGKGMGK